MHWVVSSYYLVIDVCVSPQGGLSYSSGYIQLSHSTPARANLVGSCLVPHPSFPRHLAETSNPSFVLQMYPAVVV